MRKLLWVLAVLVVGVGAVLAFAAYSASTLVARFKPDIERAASDALHASVTLGSISASIFPSVQLNVYEARIAAQPGSADALVLKGLALHVKLLPLLSRRLVIETVSLNAPTVTVVKTKGGMFVEGLPRVHAAEEPPAPQPAAPQPAAPRPIDALAAPAAAALHIELRTFKINDATFTLRDVENQKDLSVRNINVAAALSMTGDTATVSSLSLRADLPAAQRVSVNGAGQSFNIQTGQLALGDLKASIPGGDLVLAGVANVNQGTGEITLSSDGIELAQLLPLVAVLSPAVAGMKLGGTVHPDMKASFDDTEYRASGKLLLRDVAFERGTLSVSDVSGPLVVTADKTKQTVTTAGLPFVLKDKPGKISFSAVVEGDTARIEGLTLAALSGSLTGGIETSLVPPNRFDAHLQGAGFSVAEVMAVAQPRAPVHVEGVVTKLALHTRGYGQGDVAKSLEGTAVFAMRNGVIKGVNVAAVVLEALTRVPLLAGAVDTAAYRKYVSSKDTAIASLTGDFTISSGWIATQNLAVVSELFSLTGSGKASFESDVDLDATITLDRELSQVLTGKAKELRAVLDPAGTLTVPLKVIGRSPNIAVRADVEKLIEGSTRNVLEGPVGKALEKALRGEKTGDKLLDRLFGK